MSQPRYYWYGIAKKMIMESSDPEKQKSLQAYIFKKAIEDALKETAELPNGSLRLQAVDQILIKHNTNYDRFAFDHHYERRVIQRWCTSFVNLVGKKAGY